MEVKWSRRARNNLENVLDYIGKDNPPAAKKFLVLVLKKVSILMEHPNLGRPGKEGTRELVIHENYVVVYRVTDCVQVLRLKHTKQKI